MYHVQLRGGGAEPPSIRDNSDLAAEAEPGVSRGLRAPGKIKGKKASKLVRV